MGIRIKKVKIKPGTKIWEAVHDIDAPDQLTDGEYIDKDNWCWMKVIYGGFNPDEQFFWVYLEPYWPLTTEQKRAINLLPNNIPFDINEDLFDGIGYDEGWIAYDYSDGKFWNECVGEIRIRSLDFSPYNPTLNIKDYNFDNPDDEAAFYSEYVTRK